MASYTYSHYWRYLRWPLLALVILCVDLKVRRYRPPTQIFQITADSPAQLYAEEFKNARITGKNNQEAPDGSAHFEDVYDDWGPMSSQSCHAFWFVPKSGERKRFLRVRESDPGSGGSVGAHWSKDSKAIFLKGQSSGIDCVAGARPEIEMIFTLADGKLWKLN